MLLKKWMRWAGLGLCAAMVPAMSAAAKPASHKLHRNNTTTSQHATVKKASKSATARKLTTSKKAPGKKLSAHHKSRKGSHSLTHRHAKKAKVSKLSKSSKK